MEHVVHQFNFGIPEGNHRQPEELPSVMANLGKGKGKRLRDWDEVETSALLECVNLPQFRHRKQNQSYVKWDAIAEEIQKKLDRTDAAITGKRCNDRMKTLKGYWKKVRTKEKNADITEDEWHKSNGLAVDWWYEAIGDFEAPRKGKLMSTPDPDFEAPRIGMLMSTPDPDFEAPRIGTLMSTPDPDFEAPRTGMFMSTPDPDFEAPCKGKLMSTPGPRKLTKKEFAARFNSLDDSQRSTLLDLIFRAIFLEGILDFRECQNISIICEWLSKVQNRGGLAIYEDVLKLVHMGLVRWQDEMGEEDVNGISTLHIQLSSLKVHQKFFKKVMDRNRAYDTRRVIKHGTMETFDARCAPLGITVLYLVRCKELELVDLSGFQKLRYLYISSCPKLRKMIGWECLRELAYIHISYCPLYEGHPPLQKFPALQEFHLWDEGQSSTQSSVNPGGELDVSGCVCLRRLTISYTKALSSISGLEGLCSLIELRLNGCTALQNLPDLSHMKDLTHLSIVNTGVEEIKGVENLLSLKKLWCSGSKLKTLPDLSHLPHLQYIELYFCPLTKDPSSPYFGIGSKNFKPKNNHVDVSDTSDTELELSQ